jgi:hypothetical protein
MGPREREREREGREREKGDGCVDDVVDRSNQSMPRDGSTIILPRCSIFFG